MERLKELVSKAKCGVYIEVNKHKDYYESVYTHITHEEKDDIPSDILDKRDYREASIGLAIIGTIVIVCIVAFTIWM